MIRAALLALLIAPAAQAAGPETAGHFGPGEAPMLVLRGTTDIGIFGPVIDAFLAAPEGAGLSVWYEQWGSNDLDQRETAACLGQISASDLVITSAVDLASRLVNDGCARPWVSARTEALPDALNWRGELFGVTQEPVVMIYNRDLVPEAEAPKDRFDLLDLLRPDGSRYAGRIATYDVEASGLGYLLAFMDSRQATTFGSLLEAFGRSEAVATCCSAEILDAVADGTYLIGYNILGSYALSRAAEDQRIAVVAPADYTLVLSRTAMIPAGAANPQAAGAMVDFLLSPAGRAALVRAQLLTPLGSEEGAAEDGLEQPGGSADLRRIVLGPGLIVGLDRHKRRLFTELWHASLRRAPAVGP